MGSMRRNEIWCSDKVHKQNEDDEGRESDLSLWLERGWPSALIDSGAEQRVCTERHSSALQSSTDMTSPAQAVQCSG